MKTTTLPTGLKTTTPKEGRINVYYPVDKYKKYIETIKTQKR